MLQISYNQQASAKKTACTKTGAGCFLPVINLYYQHKIFNKLLIILNIRFLLKFGTGKRRDCCQSLISLTSFAGGIGHSQG